MIKMPRSSRPEAYLVKGFLEICSKWTVNCSANQWTGFYMMTAFVMKELKDPEILKHMTVHIQILMLGVR